MAYLKKNPLMILIASLTDPSCFNISQHMKYLEDKGKEAVEGPGGATRRVVEMREGNPGF